MLATLLLLGPASRADPARLEFQHGVSILHELKYPHDFHHFAFVPQREAEATYTLPFPDGWRYDSVKADHIEISN